MNKAVAETVKGPEKRRALGRGLESLLPGPRVVSPAAAPPSADTQQVPHRGVAPVRNDTVVGDLRGVVEEGAGASSSASVAGPLLATDARSGAPGSGGDDGGRTEVSAPHVPSELRSDRPIESAQGGQPGAAVPTQAVDGGESSRAGAPAPHEGISISAQAGMPGNLVVHLPLVAIGKNPYQTRIMFDEDALRDLAYSIKESGVVQPVVVRPGEKEGHYILVLGERRLRASKIAGKETIPAIVRRVSEQQAAELTIVENLQREDLNCLEQAEAFRVLSKEFNLTQAQIAERVGVSRESVSNYMRLLRLPDPVKEYLAEGDLGFSEAMVLLQVEDEEKLEKLAEAAVQKSMNVEQIRDAVMRLDGYDPKTGLDVSYKEKEKAKGGARWVDPNVRAAQNDLQRLLGMRVRIRDKKGKGKIVIEYATVDDYERVVGMLRKQ